VKKVDAQKVRHEISYNSNPDPFAQDRRKCSERRGHLKFGSLTFSPCIPLVFLNWVLDICLDTAMNSLRHVATKAPSKSSSVLAARPYVETGAVYRQFLQQTQRSNIHSFTSNSSPSSVQFYRTSLRSQFLPYEIQTTFGSASRSFHHGARLSQDKEAKSAKPGEPAAEDASKKASSEEADSKAEGEEKAKDDSEGDGKKEEKKEAPPPPPPHGDKSPWQVFTETLSSEFKASKEWNESTKALAAGAQQFTENESVRKAREAYEKSTGAVSSTAGKVLKTTAGAVGKGAAWTWETPVVKGVRTTVNATATVIEKGTRPIRETEAYKNVKNVIDDGSSSRYGGWVEKEDRRKARELRELEEARKAGHSGKRVEVLQEDPE
jgi:import inner membrane translocase subunit TIM44